MCMCVCAHTHAHLFRPMEKIENEDSHLGLYRLPPRKEAEIIV